MDPQQQFCLKWNSYTSNLAHTFSNYFKSESLADVTLFCGGTIFKAHKLILAACSKHFADLFQSAAINGNCCVILEATSAENMSALLEFMYKGEVHVSQESLNSFLKAAECLQVKGLSTEHGRLAAAPSPSSSSAASSVVAAAMAAAVAASTHDGSMPLDATPPPPPTTTTGRRGGRNGSTNSLGAGVTQECDSLMHHPSSSFNPYISPIYRPSSYDPLRKKHLKSPYQTSDALERGSVLRDGSKSAMSIGDITGGSGNRQLHRPGSSASSTGPTETDYMQVDGSSANQSSPSSTGGLGNVNSNEKNRNGAANDDEKESVNTGAEDLRIKSEPNFSPLGGTNTQPPTPTTPGSPFVSGGKNNGGSSASNAIDAVTNPSLDASLAGNLANIATADMLNIWTASKLASKGGSVNTADGKKLKCPFCDRLYGYETNLRAHIRQRHQGIRVHCPYCTRTFTRNNTVRRHIAREHKHEQFSVNKFEPPSIPLQNHSQ